jgi:hypothetical protein
VIRSTEGEQVPIGFDLAETERIPVRMMPQRLKERSIERDRATFAGFGLALADRENCFFRSTWFQRKWRISPFRMPALSVNIRAG